MSLINLTVKHGRTLEEARSQLGTVVQNLQTQFGTLVNRVEWSGDRNSVNLSGAGFHAEVRVDDQAAHAVVDIPLLAGLLGRSLTSGLQETLEQAFQKRLT